MQRNHGPHLIASQVGSSIPRVCTDGYCVYNVASRAIYHPDALDFEKVGWDGMGDFSATGTLYPSDRCGKEEVAKGRRALFEARNDPSAR